MSVQVKEPKPPVKRHSSKLPGPRNKEQRRGTRMNSRVPVRVEWDLPSGKRFTVETHTRVVNPYGCMLVLEQDLPVEYRLALTNTSMDTSNAAVIVWKSEQRPEGGWEYGIELVAPALDFWGLEL